MQTGFVKAWFRCVRYACSDFAYDPDRGVLPPKPDRGVLPPKRGKKDDKQDDKKDDKKDQPDED